MVGIQAIFELQVFDAARQFFAHGQAGSGQGLARHGWNVDSTALPEFSRAVVRDGEVIGVRDQLTRGCLW